MGNNSHNVELLSYEGMDKYTVSINANINTIYEEKQPHLYIYIYIESKLSFTVESSLHIIFDI